ncbi:hypothetical protein [Microbacterium karelineae]|uniref:hypothetical protein n=1 Tax=Microbacterium karelineae TaxID=2654283 RepID=UPI0012EAC98A|nr:hypothetical protein [Microbacterium karelineae]
MTEGKRGPRRRFNWGLGIGLGVAVGVGIWVATDDPMWLGIGAVFAVMFAVAFSTRGD